MGLAELNLLKLHRVRMETANIRDVLTSFSPSLDFLAISSGDGRIKVYISNTFCNCKNFYTLTLNVETTILHCRVIVHYIKSCNKNYELE